MAKFIIKGGKKLSGEIEVKGAKNATLPILTATLLASGVYTFSNIPELKDVEVMIDLLRHLGLVIKKLAPHTYRITNQGIKNIEAPYELVKAMRASFLVMGPLLGSAKKARVSMPGGCAIGARPVNFHLNGFENLGVKITVDHGFINAEAKELIGAEINLPFPTVTGTENLVMAAVKAKGRTIINNAAREPEVGDLCNLLNKMGAKISGINTDKLEINGVDKLQACDYEVIPDRIEIGTFIILSALFQGKILIKNARLDLLVDFIKKIEKAGIIVEKTGEYISAKIFKKINPLKVATEPYPGFPTDLQPQLMVLLNLANGDSTIEENIFENRFRQVPELNRLGAKITIFEKTATITGVEKLTGTEVTATDLRAGAALVLAGLIAENTTTINEAEHLERGYEDLVGRLQALGADIKKQT